LVLCDTKAGADTNEAKLKRWDNIQLLKKNREEFLGAQWKALVSEESQRNLHLQQRFSNIIAQVTDEGIATGLVALATRNESSPYLSQISVPTLIVVGEEDKLTPPAEAEILHQGIRESQKILIPKVGHLSNLEDPQKFNDCLSEYLLRFS
jgi:pimeloyl-ACP methyl ester carboxylesterase